jgi:hypothetical protein
MEEPAMTSTSATTMENNCPAGIAWSAMPLWFHLATLVYFATNIFNGAVFVHLHAPTPATALACFGLIGGFIEHLSPYFPKLYINPKLEKILFRAPTIAGGFWLAVWMGLAWYVIAFFAAQMIIFMREEPLTSMDPRFHAQHVFGTHLFGSVQMYVLVLVASGQYPTLNALMVG